jgi:heat-inducible transcriptional repressor
MRFELAARVQCLQRELVEDIAWVAQLIADATREAGVAVHPIGEEASLEAVSIVPLLDQRVLGIVVTSDGMVEKRALTLSGVWGREDLLVLSNYITAVFRNMKLSEIRSELESSDSVGDESVESLTEPYRAWAESVVLQLFELPADVPDVCVAGAERLLASADFQEAGRIRSLVRTLEDRNLIAKELAREPDGECRTRYIIGRESEMTANGNLGIVASFFYHQGRKRGAVGVVGPRRMDYGRIVPVVEFIGDTLTKMLEEGGAENV